MNIVERYLWVEKYRPKQLQDVVLPEHYMTIFNGFVEEKEIPTLLFYGPPGSGKTTIARILIDNVICDNMDLLELNGSVDNGINVVRDTIEEFLKVPTFGSGKIKIVFIDEADFMSPQAQGGLRSIMEKYSDHARFLFTGNYISKFDPAIISRSQMFEFKKMAIEYVVEYCEKILKTEEVSYDKVFVEKSVSAFYPDVRKIVNLLQSRSVKKVLVLENKDLVSNEKIFRSYLSELILNVQNNNMSKINVSISDMIKLLKEVELDYITLYQEMFNDDKVPVWAKIIINQYANTHTSSMIPGMHLMSCMYQTAKAGVELVKLRK